MSHDDPASHDAVPEHVREVIEHVPYYEGSREEAPVAEMIDKMQRGLCMTCEHELGMNAVIGVGEPGIIFQFCSPVCMTDQMVVGWIEEVHDDLVDRINFRRDNEA